MDKEQRKQFRYESTIHSLNICVRHLARTRSTIMNKTLSLCPSWSFEKERKLNVILTLKIISEAITIIY